MQRGALLTVLFVLTAPSLNGCGLFGGSSSIDDALEVMPGTLTRVTFFDRAAAVDRLEPGDIDAGSSEADIDAYLDQAQELPWRTELDLYLVPMLEDGPFTALDVEWEVVGYDGDDGFGRVWKMNDDLDLDDVADELVDEGYEETGSGDARTLSGPDQVDPDRTVSPALLDLTIVPDEHLVITGPLADDVLAVVNDDADSAVDTGAFEDLVDSTDDVEVADLARDDDVCSLDDSRLAPEHVEASGVGELGRPEASGFFVHGDEGETRSVMVFGDDEAAEDDADARRDFLAEGSSPVSAVPFSEFGDWEVEADGDQVRIDIDFGDPQTIPAVISRRDYPSVCPPADTDAG